jgi:hypothetical protein
MWWRILYINNCNILTWREVWTLNSELLNWRTTEALTILSSLSIFLCRLPPKLSSLELCESSHVQNPRRTVWGSSHIQTGFCFGTVFLGNIKRFFLGSLKKKNSLIPGMVSKYSSTLANLTLILLFSKMLKFSKIISSKSKNILKENREYLGIFHLL